MRLTRILFAKPVGGPQLPRPLRPRKYDVFFNNKWQDGRLVTVPDLGYKDACIEKGIKVFKPSEIFTNYLPEKKFITDFDFSRMPIMKGFDNPKDHPYYHERPAYTYHNITRLVENVELMQAKVCICTRTKLTQIYKAPENTVT